MNQLLEKEWLTDLLQGFKGGNLQLTKSSDCPDEEVYFDIIEDNADSDLLEHVYGCAYCSQIVVRLAKTMMSDDLSKSETEFLSEKSGTYMSEDEVVHDKVEIGVMENMLVPKFHSLNELVAYRSEQNGPFVLSKNIGQLELQLEFMKGKTSTTQLVMELKGIADSPDFEVELWGEDRLLRAFSLASGMKQALSKWQPGAYLLKLKLRGKYFYRLLIELTD